MRPLPLPSALHACTGWLPTPRGVCCEDVTPYLSLPFLGPLVGALLVLLLLAIPSPAQHQIVGLLEGLLWLQPLPPDGYCAAMGAKQEAKEAAAGSSTRCCPSRSPTRDESFG